MPEKTRVYIPGISKIEKERKIKPNPPENNKIGKTEKKKRHQKPTRDSVHLQKEEMVFLLGNLSLPMFINASVR